MPRAVANIDSSPTYKENEEKTENTKGNLAKEILKDKDKQPKNLDKKRFEKNPRQKLNWFLYWGVYYAPSWFSYIFYGFKNVVLAAIHQSPENAAYFNHASDKLKNSKEFVISALKLNRNVWEHIDEKLKKDKEVLMAYHDARAAHDGTKQ